MAEHFPNHEQNTEEQFDRINFLLDELESVSDPEYDGLSLNKKQYPQLASYGFEGVDLIFQDDGSVSLEAMSAQSGDEMHNDIFMYLPDEEVVEHESITRNFNQQIADLEYQFHDVNEDLVNNQRLSQYTYNEMLETLEDGEHSDVVKDYLDLKHNIYDWRNFVYDTDEANDSWQQSLDQREENNEINMLDVLTTAAITDSDLEELLEQYHQYNINKSILDARSEELVNKIKQEANIRITDRTTINPQHFIDMLDMLNYLVQDDKKLSTE